MPDREVKKENPVITATFAHYCGPWEFDRVRPIFAERGYELLTPDLPVGDPDATLDDHAEILRAAQEERGAEEYVDFGHSFSGDIGYRRLGRTPVSLLILAGAPLRPVQQKIGLPVDPGCNGLRYGAYVRNEAYGRIDFERDRNELGQALFGDLEESDRQWATSQVRPHPHIYGTGSDENAVLPSNIPLHYVIFGRDKVLTTVSQQLLANRLGLENSIMNTGHFGMIENPSYFVDFIIRIIESKTEERRRALGHVALN